MKKFPSGLSPPTPPKGVDIVRRRGRSYDRHDRGAIMEEEREDDTSPDMRLVEQRLGEIEKRQQRIEDLLSHIVDHFSGNGSIPIPG